MTYLEPTNTLRFDPASAQNPDALSIISKDANAAAATVIVLSPAPATGTVVLLQIVSTKAPGPANGTWQFYRTTLSTDTPASIALSLAQQIAGVSALQAIGVGAQYVSGTAMFGISHHFDDPITVSAAAWNPQGQQIIADNGGVFTIFQARAALDAGPIYAANRAPTGWTPTAGSNVGQFLFQGPSTDTVGQATKTYAGVAGNILDPHPSTIRGEFEIDTAGQANGQPSKVKRAAVSWGLYMSDATGNSLADMGPGTINATALYVNGVKIA